MSRLMFVTVGTSLFHSASWEPADGLPVEIPHYQRWLADDKLRSPDARMVDRHGDAIRNDLRAVLDAGHAGLWARCLPASLREGNPEPETVLRYGAELTTILALAVAYAAFELLVAGPLLFSNLMIDGPEGGIAPVPPPDRLIFCAAVALSLGVILQLAWDEKPLTEPL